MRGLCHHARFVPFVAAVLIAGFAFAQQPPPDYGIDFVTVGDPGNPACALPDPGGISYADGRGSVPYEYRIGRAEITTGQWLQFVNTFSTLGGTWTGFAHPSHWGAEVDPTYSGPGARYRLRDAPSASVFPVGGISWRTAAMYCNWLTNAQATGTWALQNGAYDASTFTTNPDQTFNDQLTHNPSATFWIPTLDEWIKAAHYDPNRNGAGQGGWWMYPNGTDTPLTYGPPPTGQANSGFTLPNFGNWNIPLGAYPGTVSPWGLLDVAGGATEWIEEAFGTTLGPEERGTDGSGSGWNISLAGLNDRVTRLGSDAPQVASSYQGFRIASSVPAPAGSAVVAMSLCYVNRRKKRRVQCASSSKQ